MPGPPYCTGLATSGQATLHFPLLSSASPAQRNRLHTLSKSSSNCFGAWIEVKRYTGIELRTDRTNSRLPAGFKKMTLPSRQPGPSLVHDTLQVHYLQPAKGEG